MEKKVRDRINAVKSQLADLKRPKLDKNYYSLDRIAKLEEELKQLQDENNSLREDH